MLKVGPSAVVIKGAPARVTNSFAPMLCAERQGVLDAQCIIFG